MRRRRRAGRRRSPRRAAVSHRVPPLRRPRPRAAQLVRRPARSSLLAIYRERSGGVLEVWSPAADRHRRGGRDRRGARRAVRRPAACDARRRRRGAPHRPWPPRCYVLNDAAQDTVVALREVVAAEGGVQLVEASPSDGELVEAKADAGGSSDGDPCERALRLLEAGQDGAAETVLLSVRGDLPLKALAAPLLDPPPAAPPRRDARPRHPRRPSARRARGCAPRCPRRRRAAVLGVRVAASVGCSSRASTERSGVSS